LPEHKSQTQPESVLPATDHTARCSLGALLLAGFIALSALASPAVSQEGVLGDVPMSEGYDPDVNDPGVEATVEQSEAANNSADAE
jgi:hypothetical protein